MLRFFQDLILVGKDIIVCTHLIITIINLRFSNKNIFTSYLKIHGYTKIFPQQLGLLISFLFLSNFYFQVVI